MRNQLDTFGASEFGVQTKYLDGESHLVDDALSRSMLATEQFKVFDSVVLSTSVDVVHGFVGQELSSNVLLHDESVFENFMQRDAVAGRYSKHDIFAFNASSYLRKAVTFAMQLACPFVFALLTAQGLFLINGSRTFSATSVEFFTAVFAIGFVSLIGILAAASGRTRYGTVDGFLTEFFAVSGQISRFVGKSIPAFSAGEMNFWQLRRRSSVQSFVLSFASNVAKTLVSKFRRYFKRLTTLLTSVDDSHLPGPFASKATLG